jgi:hypothetical protein
VNAYVQVQAVPQQLMDDSNTAYDLRDSPTTPLRSGTTTPGSLSCLTELCCPLALRGRFSFTVAYPSERLDV